MFGCEFDEMLSALYNGRRGVDDAVMGLYIQVRVSEDNPTNRLKYLYLKDAIGVASQQDGVAVKGGIPEWVLDEIRLALGKFRDGGIPAIELHRWLVLLECREPVGG
jgi:hypothetical protein